MAQGKISIIPLGGRGEIGNNMIIIENEKDIIILDAGVLFPDQGKFGIDLIIPDISYLVAKKDKIRALIISHGHEDHIGATPYILQMINPPIYGTDLTLGLIESKLKQFNLNQKVKLISIGSNKDFSKLDLNSFQVEFCHVNHSIPASVAMAIHTPVGLIIYTGDYKFDQTPVDNPQTDYQQLSTWGRQGVLALIGDSTNAEREGHTLSEEIVAQNIENSFRLAPERIIIATFSSNIDRIQQIIKAAHKLKRKLAVAGRSMLNTMEIASKLGYLNIPEDMLISLEEAKKTKGSQLILLMTGSQGEDNAALSRMARGDHRDIDIIPGDTVYLSASPIPGNEKAIGKTINQLYSRGAQVIYGEMLDVHASGHACQEELKFMINLCQPKFLIPTHGEFRHLYHHAQLGKKMGIPVENIFIAENGSKLELTKEKGKITDKIKSGQLYVENNIISGTADIVVDDRHKLSENGFVNLIISLNKKQEILNNINLVTRGFIYNQESQPLLAEAKKELVKLLKKQKNKKINEKDISNSLKNFFYQKTNRAPLIITTIITQEEEII